MLPEFSNKRCVPQARQHRNDIRFIEKVEDALKGAGFEWTQRDEPMQAQMVGGEQWKA
jgi:hypothetical protein